jgi:hypothetical protein
MARPKTDPWYAARIGAYAEDGMSAAAIARKLEEDASEAKRSDVPSERTVRRLYEEHKMSSEAERLQSTRFRWPESMMLGLLPWEASRTALTYLFFRRGTDGTRPTVREVKWFWRLHLASPQMPHQRVQGWTTWLTAWEYARGKGDAVALSFHDETLEAEMAIEPWESADSAEMYEMVRPLFNAEAYSPDAVSLPFTSAIFHRYIEILKGKEWADVFVAKEREVVAAGEEGVSDQMTRLDIRLHPKVTTKDEEEDNG